MKAKLGTVLLVLSTAIGLSAGGSQFALGATRSTAPQFLQVSAGYGVACAIRGKKSTVPVFARTHSVACWGADGTGQADPPSGVLFSQVSAGDEVSCGVKLNGAVTCWGHDQEGQSVVPPSGKFTQVSEGSVVWSAGEDRPLGCGVRTNETIGCWGETETPAGAFTPPSGTFSQVSVGQAVALEAAFACALKTNQTILCWGDNTDGESAAPSGKYSQVSASQGFACGLRTSGQAVCWGNGAPIAGHGAARPPVPPAHDRFTSIGGACGVLDGGSLACWDGQVNVPGGRFSSVSGGYVHSGVNDESQWLAQEHPEYCGLTKSGNDVCWQEPR